MKKKKRSILTRPSGLAMVIALGVCLATAPVMAAEGMEPDADKILRAMSSCLGGVKAFSVNADIDYEVLTQEGQKLQLSSYAMIVLERPSKYHISRKGLLADTEFVFDGETLTLHGKNLNVYARIPVSGTIDDAIRAYELETGIPAPGADLMFSDLYAALSAGVVRGTHLGTAYINGVACHHLAFREAEVDWQLWVKAGDTPLPMKYIITSKRQAAAPQYAIRLRDWNLDPAVESGQFTFTAPQGATEIDSIPINAMGEPAIGEEK